MNDLRLYLLAGHRPTSANDKFFRAVLDRLMQHEHGFAVRRMPSGLNDRGLRAGQLAQPPHHPPSPADKELAHRMASATSLRPNFRWFGRDGRSRQAPQLASSFGAKLVVPGTDGPSIGRRGPTRCHSRENRGVYPATAVREKRRR